MLGCISGALFRAFLVCLLAIVPALALHSQSSFPPELIVFLGIVAASLTFIEYNSHYPSIIEFRDAPPINRLRFAAVAFSIFTLTLLARHDFSPSNLTVFVSHIGLLVGQVLDFPFSPVRLIVLMLPPDADVAFYNSVRGAAGMAYVICMIAVLIFLASVRGARWPNVDQSAFNVWTNLPLFDPTAGGDVVARMTRDGRINIVLGILLPFCIPVVVRHLSEVIDPYLLRNPLTLIWTMTAWSLLPASMIMRGIALGRIAGMIETKRRRTYAEALEETVQTA